MGIAIAVLAAAAATAVPRVTGPIPVTAGSYPFLAANRVQEVVDLARLQYVEEEFFIAGTANVYDWTENGSANGTLIVRTSGAPYTTRILVRRPSDPRRFSGNVIVEPLNNARAYDWAFVWAYSYEYFAERGDAWVGVTHLPAAVAALKRFNASRYAPLSLANPSPDERCGRGNAASDSEEGLRWDMFSQLGALLKSGATPGPLGGFRVERVYAASHYGELATYVNAVHNHARLDNGRPIYDGYLIKANEDPSRIRRCAAPPPEGDPRLITRNVDVPVIRMIAQGDVLETATRRREDSDEPGDRFRLYEVAGAPHMDTIFYRHMPIVQDQIAAGQTGFDWHWPLAYRCDPDVPLMDSPVMRDAANAALASLDRWVRRGTPAPRAERIAATDGGTSGARFVTDQFGNAVGGVRSPSLDVPAATYHPSRTGPMTCRSLGYTTPFESARLDALYGSSKSYATKVAASVDRLVRQRWLTESAGRRIKTEDGIHR
jgi:hypothetical protein